MVYRPDVLINMCDSVKNNLEIIISISTNKQNYRNISTFMKVNYVKLNMPDGSEQCLHVGKTKSGVVMGIGKELQFICSGLKQRIRSQIIQEDAFFKDKVLLSEINMSSSKEFLPTMLGGIQFVSLVLSEYDMVITNDCIITDQSNLDIKVEPRNKFCYDNMLSYTIPIRRIKY